MNEYEIMIKNLGNRVTELEKQLFARTVKTVEPVKWQPKGGDWYIGYAGEIFGLETTGEAREFGTERQTKEQAQRASVEMRRFNRLLALRDELCGDEVVSLNWKNGEEKHYLYHWNGDTAKWRIGIDTYSRMQTPYFTNYDSAQKACDMLNSGEVEL
jgi:hypothetical protein